MKRKRRLQAKTDYKARIILLQSKKPRLVFRKTNKYITGQYIKSAEGRDSVILGVTSKNLMKFGWKQSGNLKSLPASYLTGFLIGKKVLDTEENEAIFDIGLLRNIKGSKLYAFLKGAIDAGLKIKAGENIFPDEARLLGRHMKTEVKLSEIKLEIEKKFK